MSLAASRDRSNELQCWCCGGKFLDSELTRFGRHPEVAVCFACVADLHRRARMTQTSNLKRPIYSLGDTIRAAVIARGWHRRPIIGRLLRGLGRVSPW
jgi:hypothetical protein